MILRDTLYEETKRIGTYIEKDSAATLDMISIVTKLPTWLFSVRFVLDLILIITTTLHDWCFPSLRLPVAIYFHLLATIYLHYIPLLLLLLYYSITFLIPDYQNTNLS